MDIFLIPVFVLFFLLVPVVALALLLYAVPVRAAIRLVRNEAMQVQTLEISWAGLRIRTSGTGADMVNEVLIGEFLVFTHTGTAGSPSVGDAGRPAGTITPVESPVPPDGPKTNATPAGSLPAGAPAASPLQAGWIIHSILQIIGPFESFGSVFWKASRFVDARGTLTLGLGNPVLMGEVCGMYWASRFILQASRVYVELEPVFDREVLNLDITVRMKVSHPLLILIAGIRLVRDPKIAEVTGAILRQPQGATAT
jgi:hypothetical protein